MKNHIYVVRENGENLHIRPYYTIGAIKNCLRSEVTWGTYSKHFQGYVGWAPLAHEKIIIHLEEVNKKLENCIVYELQIEPLKARKFQLFLDDNDQWVERSQVAIPFGHYAKQKVIICDSLSHLK